MSLPNTNRARSLTALIDQWRHGRELPLDFVKERLDKERADDANALLDRSGKRGIESILSRAKGRTVYFLAHLYRSGRATPSVATAGPDGAGAPGARADGRTKDAALAAIDELTGHPHAPAHAAGQTPARAPSHAQETHARTGAAAAEITDLTRYSADLVEETSHPLSATLSSETQANQRIQQIIEESEGIAQTDPVSRPAAAEGKLETDKQ